MNFYSLISSLILSVLFISGSESVRTLKHIAGRRGDSLTVPCFYSERHRPNRKYWGKGQIFAYRSVIAYTNTSDADISVTDHPSQNMFTVDLRNLRDSGYYWCAVKAEGYSDERDSVRVTVGGVPYVEVENSRVSGEVGGSVSVRGFCSSGYKDEVKKWCRFKDWKCYPVGRTNTSQTSAVLITENSNTYFTVEMSGLQKSDAGWYWFSAGDVQVPVYLTVTDKSTDSEIVKTPMHLTVRIEKSLSVPCFYDEKYKSHRKYWCKGETWSSCSIVADTNTTNKGISVNDNPSQNMFTVDLNNLQDSDSGWYWCAVEVNGTDMEDYRNSVQLTVSNAPVVWMTDSRESFQEGGEAHTHGFYRIGGRYKARKWCRVKDWSCSYVGKTKTSQGSEVVVTDNTYDLFNVKISGLQKDDAGWYWFGAGDVGVTFHLTVIERPTKN